MLQALFPCFSLHWSVSVLLAVICFSLLTLSRYDVSEGCPVLSKFLKSLFTFLTYSSKVPTRGFSSRIKGVTFEFIWVNKACIDVKVIYLPLGELSDEFFVIDICLFGLTIYYQMALWQNCRCLTHIDLLTIQLYYSKWSLTKHNNFYKISFTSQSRRDLHYTGAPYCWLQLVSQIHDIIKNGSHFFF